MQKIKYSIDEDGLRNYLLSLKDGDFDDATKLERSYEIDLGTPYLVDALGNDLTIIENSKLLRKLPTGRTIYGIFIKTIIPNCKAVYGNPQNGKWRIPSQFINWDTNNK